jgi:hypothetical protein
MTARAGAVTFSISASMERMGSARGAWVETVRASSGGKKIVGGFRNERGGLVRELKIFNSSDTETSLRFQTSLWLRIAAFFNDFRSRCCNTG